MESEKTKLTENLAFPETDVTLVVEGQKIHVNKSVLSEHSPVFETMFKSQFRESTAKEIPMEDKKAEDVVEFLSCFYPKMKHPVKAENVLQVLPIAHEYESTLVTNCEDLMIAMCKPDKRLTVSTLLDYILAGEKYGFTRFIEAAVELCARIEFDLLNGKKFHHYLETQEKDISLKFSKIGINTKYAISKKRLERIEKYYRKNPDTSGNDVAIRLS